MFYGIFVVLALFFLASRYVVEDSDKMLVFYSAVLFLIVVCGLRDPFIYPDNISYYEFFNGDFSAADDGTLNIGYLLLNGAMGMLTSSFQVFCFVVALIITCSYSKFIISYSPYIWLSLFLYVLINYLPSFFLLRQYLAMPFVFMSFKYVIERKQKMYWICALLAFSIHTTALIILPLYYMYGISYSRRNMLIVFGGTILASLSFMAIGAIIGSYFSYYSQYLDMQVEDPAWQRALMKVFILLVYLFAMKGHFYNSGINRLVFYSMLMNVIICIGAMNFFGVFRLREFFSLADFIGIPIILSATSQMFFPKKHVVSFLTVVYMVLLVISYISFAEGGNMENGYNFFWESSQQY